MSITHSAIRRLCLSAAFLCVLLLLVPPATAQADPAQYKTQSLSVFAGYLYDHQDYSRGYNSGIMLGADFTRHIRFPLQPSLEARINLAPGSDVTERTFLFGPVINAQLGPLRPYGDFQLGVGVIHFNHPDDPFYTRDGSAVYAGGGGLEYNLVRNVRLKLDVQYQHWNLGHTSATVFTPVIGSVGIAYTIPFRSFRKYNDPSYR